MITFLKNESIFVATSLLLVASIAWASSTKTPAPAIDATVSAPRMVLPDTTETPDPGASAASQSSETAPAVSSPPAVSAPAPTLQIQPRGREFEDD